MVTVDFQSGTLLVDGPAAALARLSAWCIRDERVGRWRAECRYYGEILTALHGAGIAYADRARAFRVLDLVSREVHPPRDYQRAAVRAWQAAGRRGVIALPTG
ncbi:MAG: hypothetical protein JXR77_10455, partial [Lentisphaeria bacterium]|nr:hypothetical protein [Lentisphaeria bacterium]